MSIEQKKFLDEKGLKVLWNQVNLNDYPNNETLIAVINAIDETKADISILDNKQDKITIITTIAENNLMLNDNTEYYLTNISSLIFAYPENSFESWIKISFSSTETIDITLPEETQYIGEVPTFNNGETWEISIKDGVAVCWRVE